MRRMKYRLNIISVLLILSTSTGVLHSCIKEIELIDSTKDELGFTVRINNETTKASSTIQLSGEAGVIGYLYNQWPSAEGISNLKPWEKLSQEIYTFDGDQLKCENTLIKWSEAKAGGDTLKIYAYSPASDENMTVSYGSEGSYTIPSLTYTVPQNISQQKDIVTAVTEVKTKDNNKKIPLTFDHILTGVKFKAGFDCKVNSITINNVASTGIYEIGSGWSEISEQQSYQISFAQAKSVNADEMITIDSTDNVVFMIPQSFDTESTASITLSYDNGKELTTSLAGRTWESGRMITYTLYEKTENIENKSDTLYFDLAAGPFTIKDGKYTGSVYVNCGAKTTFTDFHKENYRYYIYQSTKANKNKYGWEGKRGSSKHRKPVYTPVKYKNKLWRDWITNNTDVEGVISAWSNENYDVAKAVGRDSTGNYITINGQANQKYHIIIDNLYSSTQHIYGEEAKAGIRFTPGNNDCELTVNIVGDNRFGCIRYWNGGMKLSENNSNNKLIFEGTGSLTVADVIDTIATVEKVTGHWGNHFNSAIGATDHGPKGSEGIVINGGVIFAGTTAAENSSAIGGGGNGVGVITINGGTVTAVAHTTGTAIGGGIGFSSAGGPGYVTITGGNVYAYNLENPHGIPSAAIGGAGSSSSSGNVGYVNITGGNVYALSVGGTAIGGGSSKSNNGGEGNVTITGGTVIAKSIAGVIEGSNTAGAGIGGGTGGSSGNGGKATVNISGNPIIRTGSIGGGKTNKTEGGYIGTATISIDGGDIQGQFVMAAGALEKPSFAMKSGLIRNSDIEDDVYIHIQDNGGAVYLEDGSFTMEGGEIRQCYAEKGGAIYVKGKENTTFKMTGGKISECSSKTDGGAVYLEGGKVMVSGGEVSYNLAKHGNGGGFCIVGGNFIMDENCNAVIKENAAFSKSTSGGKGGGLYVTSLGSDVKVDILSGSIISNSSDRVGGGICVDMSGHESASATVTVGQKNGANENPKISENHSIILGGGLYAQGPKAGIIINSGQIIGNTISGYASNPDVANEKGMVTLNGGHVTSVTVTYNNNGKYYNEKEETAEQKIVKSTNNTMVVPVNFEKLGYTLNGWNTRPDGKGKTYTEGTVMNLDSDITLYAQWEMD